MTWKWLAVVMAAVLLIGCATSPYRPAEKYIDQKEYDRSIRTYLKLLDPHMRDGKRYIYYDKEGVTGIGVVYWHMQRFETAVKILKTVLDKDPAYGKALFYLGLSYEGLGNENDAIRTYRNYAQLQSDDAFRQVIVGRLDWIVKNKIVREIETALKQEAELNIATYPDKSVAVLSFLSLSDNRSWEPLEKGLAEMVITDLSQIKDIQVVERLKVDQLLGELRLNASGLTDDKNSLRFGKLVGARNLIKGSYLVMNDQKMTLDAGIFEAGKTAVPANFSFDGNLARLFQMEKELVLNIINYFGITLTPQERERLLKIPTENLDAFISYCNGLDALDRNNFKSATRFFQEAFQRDSKFDQARDYLVMPEIWDVTHSQNVYRMSYEVAQWIKTSPRGRAQIEYKPPPEMLSTYNRLQLMGIQQNSGFLPGNESRKSFEEASLNGAQLLPYILGEPPKPPQR
jgi:tetratricopeptide (TPR) repeat protein